MSGPDVLLPAIPTRPYPGVESYSYADRQIFFARESDARKLAALITIYRSVLLYGVSGTGKSSLINAAVIPLMIEDGFSPERIRVQPRPGEEIVVERLPTTSEPGPPYLPSVFANADDDRARIVLSARRFRERLDAVEGEAYPLLIFDQFEEFVSLFEEAPQGDALRVAKVARDDVRDLLLQLMREMHRRVKILFVFREDYLAKLDELFTLIPDLRHRYLRLAPPPLDTLQSIIRGPFVAFPGRFSPELPEALAAQLQDEFTNATGTLNLSEVQLVCTRLVHSQNPAKEFRDRGLQGLLEDSLSEALRRLPADLRDPAVALLGRMVTDAGLRNVISRDDLLARARKEDGFRLERLERSLEALVSDTRLVRQERRRDVLFFEIISEFLVPWISRQRLLRQGIRQRRRTRAIFSGISMAAIIVAVVLVRYLATSLSNQLAQTQGQLAQAQQRISTLTGSISFISIVVDEETAQADRRLKNFLEQAIAQGESQSGRRSLRFPHQALPYGEAIRALVERGPDRGYLGRITPYAFVVAEMLGAKLDILATYKSVATRDTIYHSYFVVRKDRFRAVVKRRAEDGATFEDVTAYLKGFREVPARFVYHDRFSTSSYFIPSLYFKARDIFAVDQPTNPSFIPIQVERLPSTSSADLVARVVNGGADLAAVWDGTKHMFENDPARAAMNAQVLFIRIPTAIPNDFLVASGIDGERERLIIEAIKNEPGAGRPCTELTESTPAAIPRRPCSDPSIETPRDDFDGWYAWDSVPESAKEALASLRQSARPQITPVVVRIEGLAGRRVSMADVEAVREAVRLSGTELVPEDRNLHKRVDMTWTLDSTHDGALRLTSTLDSSFGQSAEEFIISFVDRRELPQRIADLIRSRMRRIRYVWPFEQKYPVVLRDLDFTPDNIVKVQRISWRDPDTNEYEEDTPFSAQIEDSTDFSKLRLSDEVKFARNPDGSFNFDPISNVAYRVIIEPEPRPGRIWIVVTYLALAALALACVGLIVDLNRHAAAAR